jgi:hypothetical protein
MAPVPQRRTENMYLHCGDVAGSAEVAQTWLALALVTVWGKMKIEGKEKERRGLTCFV